MLPNIDRVAAQLVIGQLTPASAFASITWHSDGPDAVYIGYRAVRTFRPLAAVYFAYWLLS